MQEFAEEMVADRAILNLTNKDKVEVDGELNAVFSGTQTAIVTIKTPNGGIPTLWPSSKGEQEKLLDDEFRTRYNGTMEYACVFPSISVEIYDTVYRENAKAEEPVEQL